LRPRRNNDGLKHVSFILRAQGKKTLLIPIEGIV